MITTLLFDMGNVLIHYDPQHFLERMGLTGPQDQELLLREISHSPLWPKLDEGEMTEGELEALVLPRLPERLHSYAHQLIFHWDDPIEPIPGMAALLEDCKKAGLKLYLLSNASRRQPEYWGNIPGSAAFCERCSTCARLDPCPALSSACRTHTCGRNLPARA